MLLLSFLLCWYWMYSCVVMYEMHRKGSHTHLFNFLIFLFFGGFFYFIYLVSEMTKKCRKNDATAQ